MHVALLQLAGVLSGNNAILYEEKNKYESITLEAFKRGRQTYIQMKA